MPQKQGVAVYDIKLQYHIKNISYIEKVGPESLQPCYQLCEALS